MIVRGWLYLIKNGDLYKIGITKNLESRMRQLKPDYLVSKLYTTEFIKLERELHYRYKLFRIPQTEYFRLNNNHINEIKQIIRKHNYSIARLLLVFFKSLFLFFFLFISVFLFLFLNINDIDIVILKTLLYMEQILLVCSVFSLFIPSGIHLDFLSELKYRIFKISIFIQFYFLLKIANELFV